MNKLTNILLLSFLLINIVPVDVFPNVIPNNIISSNGINNETFTNKSNDESGKKVVAHTDQDTSVAKLKKLKLKDICKIEPVYFNSEYSDFGAVVIDENIVYTSAREDGSGKKPKETWKGDPYLDIYEVPIIEPKIYVEPKLLTEGLNSRYHDGPAFYTSDKKQIFITRNTLTLGIPKFSEKHENHFLLYYADCNDINWDNLIEMPFNSKEYSCGHPSITTDGSTLYFSSDMPGGFGGSDIYYTTRTDTGWSQPVNLGNTINTSGNEMFPFISADNELFFSSNGHNGMGGLDIYYTEKKDKKSYIVHNLGEPINSRADDLSFYLLPDGQSGYFASNRKGGVGDDDIYHFKNLIKPNANLTLIGKTFDIETEEILPNTDVVILNNENEEIFNGKSDENGIIKLEVEKEKKYTIIASLPNYNQTTLKLYTDIKTSEQNIYELDIPMNVIKEWGVFGFIYELESKKEIPDVEVTFSFNKKIDTIETRTDSMGNFKLLLDPDTDYEITLKKPGYYTHKGKYSTKEIEPGWNNIKEYMELSMSKIVIGEAVTIAMPKIYYDLDKWEIRKDAAIELDKVVQLLIDNDNVKIELGSHTDSRASKQYNQILSQKRAESAVEYIISRGIDKDRIIAHGYGEEKLINKCADGVPCSEEEHQQNRRTEITIIDF